MRNTNETKNFNSISLFFLVLKFILTNVLLKKLVTIKDTGVTYVV